MQRQNNLIYLCGPHGSGKTTLGRELAKENSRVLVPELYSRNLKFHTDADYRQVLKICSRAVENFEYLDIAQKNPEKIILANRCIYGVLAYNWVYWQRGWISEETYNNYNKHARDFFKNENSSPFAIVLNPGFEVVKRHLEKRWGEKGKKWNEEDLEYTELACQAYEQFQDADGIFYIDHEVDLESRLEINEANEWIENITSRELIGIEI